MSKEKTQEIVRELTRSYWMEIETVQNYLANSVDLVGVRAQEIKKSLAGDVQEELGHATKLAKRIHILGGRVPGSKQFQAGQDGVQPPSDPRNVVDVIKGVIAAEEEAIEQYGNIIEACEGEDYVTQDLCIQLKADEEAHRREFLEFLAEYEEPDV